MATIFGVTSLELTEEQEKALSAALIKDLGTLYTHALSFYLSKIPRRTTAGAPWIRSPSLSASHPTFRWEKKRQTIELLNNTMVREVGYKGRDEGHRALPVPRRRGRGQGRRALCRLQGPPGPAVTGKMPQSTA